MRMKRTIQFYLNCLIQECIKDEALGLQWKDIDFETET